MTDVNLQQTAAKSAPHAFQQFEWLARIDPAYEDARRHLARLVWAPAAPALAVKYRELVACAVLAYRAFPTLDGHLRRAVREGASVREAVEAMETAALPGGFPVIHYALPFLSAIHEEVEAGTFV